MTGLLRRIRELNGLGSTAVAEPFAGGAGASLTMLFGEDTAAVYINDLDRSLHDFWWAVVNRSKAFLNLVASTPLTIEEWRRQRAIYRDARGVSRLEHGFAAFYLNRCNRSGIMIDGGPIGGVNQTGEWKLDARFNRAELGERLAKIADYKDRIHVSGLDGLEFIRRCGDSHTFFFVDPPYFEKGELLYLNSLDSDYHAAIARRLKEMSDSCWVLTYDDCPSIREMYSDWAAIRPFSLKYAASTRRKGDEVMITPKWMRLPETQNTTTMIDW